MDLSIFTTLPLARLLIYSSPAANVDSDVLFSYEIKGLSVLIFFSGRPIQKAPRRKLSSVRELSSEGRGCYRSTKSVSHVRHRHGDHIQDQASAGRKLLSSRYRRRSPTKTIPMGRQNTQSPSPSRCLFSHAFLLLSASSRNRISIRCQDSVPAHLSSFITSRTSDSSLL